jgi:hypothetical protein
MSDEAMSDERIKDLPDITPVDTTLVPGDSTDTGTGKATIRAWVLAGLAWALSRLANAAIAAQGVWTFANNVVLSQGLTVTGLITSAFGVTTVDLIATGEVDLPGASMGNGSVENVADPSNPQDAATKNYVDTRVQLYSPTYVRGGGGGATAPLGDVYAFRTGNKVMLFGQMSFTPTAGGVLETLTFTLPSTMLPNNNFSNTSEGGGASLLGVHAATDYCTNILGVAATKTLRFSVLTAGATAIYWRATYKIDN